MLALELPANPFQYIGNHQLSCRQFNWCECLKKVLVVSSILFCFYYLQAQLDQIFICSESSSTKTQGTKRKRSRWGEKIELGEIAPPGIAVIPGDNNIYRNIFNKIVKLSQKLPQHIYYSIKNKLFQSIWGMALPIPQPVNLGLPSNYKPVGLVGVSELSQDQRKQLEEQREVCLLNINVSIPVKSCFVTYNYWFPDASHV